MRIVGGTHKGRSLKGPASQSIRPTSDRLRESLFNILAHSYSDAANGARVIDLFAGTGALGIEALSRGAAYCLFVDDGTEARSLIRGNVEALGLGGITRIFRRNAAKLGPMPPQNPFTLAFLDPPYGRSLAEEALQSLHDGSWLADDAIVVVEESTGAKFDWPEGFREFERRDYGDTQILIARYDGTR